MKRFMIAIAAFTLCVAATQWAMRGIHQPTGNAGYLGSDLAGVEGRTSEILSSGVVGLVDGNPAASVGVQGIGPTGVKGTGTTHFGVHGVATVAAAVYGEAPMTGVWGNATGTATDAAGVFGTSGNGFGVWGLSSAGTGVYGAIEEGGTGHAGYFLGRVHVSGTLSKSAGSFRIDHPLDPANKYLSHSFVESPDMKNIYDGVVVLDGDGTATVELPEWFDALNKDFRYQLTCIDEHAPVYVAEEIRENRFRIAGGYAGMKVSWQVTGSRDDAYAQAHPIVVEEDKAPHEAGRYLHPELHKQPVAQRIAPHGRRAR